ncbi:MAG: hypothetical protein EOP87_03105 [Verrucomicrobiaceae bacterium]|nr:MAG: hypothetical protein EOP87_03105 [Verrucomicrobiaceae bacterium]
MPAPSTLILAVLNIESSYLDNLERSATTVPDTVQFFFTAEKQWRIRTYAIDHDLHIHQVESGSDEEPFDPGTACDIISESYDDVISDFLMLEFPDPTDTAAVTEILRESQLTGTLVPTPEGCYFYSPDATAYRKQSNPEA